jgi:uncharacterized membrane protein YidH (DUF202 family)
MTNWSVIFINCIFLNIYMKVMQNNSDRLLQSNAMNFSLAVLIIATAGAFLQIGGTSWDVTSHLMLQPETFFTPSHTVLYTGVGLLTITAVLVGALLIKNKDLGTKSFSTSFKLFIIGSAISLIAGPSDFLWHETLGVDGLLSPPHLALITGMLINAVGVVIGITRIIVHVPPLKQKLVKVTMIPAFTALWFTTTWYVYMFALPFSNGEHFQFNLDPNVATIIALIALPLLSSMIFLTASKTIGRFGAASAIVALVAGLNVFANIIPTGNILTPLLPWYSMISIIPVIVADLILNSSIIKSKIRSPRPEIISGMIIGSIFYVFNYPMLTWTFSLPLNMPLESINNILPNFVNSMPTVLAITLVPSAIMGMIGAIISFKIINVPRSSQH